MYAWMHTWMHLKTCGLRYPYPTPDQAHEPVRPHHKITLHDLAGDDMRVDSCPLRHAVQYTHVQQT